MPDIVVTHPGQLLKTYFLDEMGITPYRVAKAIGVQQTRISEIIKGNRAITIETGLKLSRFFGLSERYWIDLQANYDIRKFLALREADIEAISPLESERSEHRTL